MPCIFFFGWTRILIYSLTDCQLIFLSSRDRGGRTLTAGVHALSQLPPRVEVWSEGFIRLMQEASIYGRVQVTEGQQSGGLR